MANIITIYGAKTLARYTEKMLVDGFQKNSWEARVGDVSDFGNIATDAVVFQLHGAPQSEKDDKVIMELIEAALGKNDGVKKVILLHRPDELQKYTDLPNILSHTVQKFGLVFFGPRFAKDKFYPSNTKILKKVIPHGFFPLESHQKLFQENPVVIGSHTTWGEMRSVEHALRLLGEVFVLNSKYKKNIVGYLGGKPAEQLQIGYLKSVCEKINPEVSIAFLDVRQYSSFEEIRNTCASNIVFIDALDAQPSFFSLTFNAQMYYFGNVIRLGESSGSAHSMVSIPVVAEINDADLVEDMRLIKVPYGNANDINTLDFKQGAKRIVDSIDNNSFRDMWNHNATQSEIWNNDRIGKEYIELFQELK